MPQVVSKGFLKTAAELGRLAIDGLGRLLFPPVCDNCAGFTAEPQKGLCADCWQAILQCVGGDYCRRCGKTVSRYGIVAGHCAICSDIEIPHDGIVRAGVYQLPLDKMILAFKFSDRTELAKLLCGLIDSALQAADFSDKIDFLVPVPLHWRRRFERGYNQSLILAKGLKSCPAAVNTDLVRIRYTERQWKLSPAKRRKNVAGAFAVRKGHKFSGKTVCLVDDITTSGATLNECAVTLKQAGAEKVYALVAAVAGADFDA